MDCGGSGMAAKKRSARRSRPAGLVDRAVRVGRKALREAESRVPSDLRRQLERSIKDGQKTLKTAIDQLQVQVRRTAKQADVEKALKRLEGLSKQVQQMAREAASRGTTSTRRAATTRRRATTTSKRTTRKASTKKKTAPARKPAAARSAAPRRAPARRRPAPEPEPSAQESTTEPGESGS
jgi:DNA-binding protein HU-beta